MIQWLTGLMVILMIKVSDETMTQKCCQHIQFWDIAESPKLEVLSDHFQKSAYASEMIKGGGGNEFVMNEMARCNEKELVVINK